jgi:hypothetical protein
MKKTSEALLMHIEALREKLKSLKGEDHLKVLLDLWLAMEKLKK